MLSRVSGDLKRGAPKVLASVLVSAAVAGCSADVSRFGDGPVYTGSTNNQQQILQGNQAQPSFNQIQAGPTQPHNQVVVQQNGIGNQPLPAPGQVVVSQHNQVTPLQPAPLYPAQPAAGAQVVNQGQLGTLPAVGAQAIAPQVPQVNPSINQLASVIDRQTTTGSIAGPMVTQSFNGWSAAGGSPITVLQGDSLSSLSRRYGVPEAAFAAVNGLAPGTPLQPGSRMIVPVYNLNTPLANPNTQQVAAVQPIQPQVVAPQTVQTAPPAVQENVAVPKRRPAGIANRVAAVTTPPATVRSDTAGTVAPSVAVPSAAARTNVDRTASITPSAPQQVPQQQSATAATGFQWPAKGPITSTFGSTINGQRNDGINITLPSGTPIKASDKGQVIYAGNEIRGYGNIVLISHSGGYVTAYAHAKDILVQRGQSVNSGDVIATVGDTGSVTEPQLHFEIRKDSTPIDPLPKLAQN